MDEKFEISAEATKKRIDRGKGRVVTERGWNLWAFGLKDRSVEFWQGKRILDVGSGISFYRPEGVFPGAKLYALDPEFGDKISLYSNWADEKRVGVVQEIPYDDNMFDLIISSHAVPQHIFPIDIPRAVFEMVRVIKPDGEIRLVPCVKEHDITSQIEDALLKSGFEVDFLEGLPDGTVTVIRANKTTRIDQNLKDEAVKNLHKALFPDLKLPYEK